MGSNDPWRDEKGTRQQRGVRCCGRGVRWRERKRRGERRGGGGGFEGGNRAPGRRGTNIVGTPRAVTNDSIDARTEKLEPEENRRSFTGTEEPTCLLSSPFSFSSFSLLPSPSTFVEPSSMASSPSRSLSPKEFRKGRSESVAADLSVMKLMPNATGGYVDQHFSPRSRSSRLLFLSLHWMDRIASVVIRRLRSL